jgi:hypothetical protein
VFVGPVVEHWLRRAPDRALSDRPAPQEHVPMRALTVAASLAATMHLADPAGCASTVGKACGFTFAGLRGERLCKPAADRHDATVAHEEARVTADVVEIGDGVRVVDGDEGQVVEFVGVHSGGHGYRLQFDSGAEIRLILPEPNMVEFLGGFELPGGPDDVSAPHAGRGRYAEFEVTSPLLARVRAFLRRKPI